MVTYCESILVVTKENYELEIFINKGGGVTVDSNNDDTDISFSFSKEDWEEIKKFIDDNI